MKSLLMLCAYGILLSASAQTNSLAISTDKTTSLIFPFPIRHVDRGNKDVLVEQVKEANNILLVKAASEKLLPTNLSVVTDDGNVYSFRIEFMEEPPVWVWNISPQKETSIPAHAIHILDNPATLHHLRDQSWNMTLRVTGIYVQAGTMYYQLQLDNRSPIDYDIALLKFYIRDKKKSKRTASQENELTPLYTAGNVSAVKANHCNTIVIALPAFTIPDAKYMAIQLLEKNGGRNLSLRLPNNKIVKAITLPELY